MYEGEREACLRQFSGYNSPVVAYAQLKTSRNNLHWQSNRLVYIVFAHTEGDGYPLYPRTANRTNCYMNTIKVMPHYVTTPFVVVSREASAWEQDVDSQSKMRGKVLLGIGKLVLYVPKIDIYVALRKIFT